MPDFHETLKECMLIYLIVTIIYMVQLSLTKVVRVYNTYRIVLMTLSISF